MARGYIGESPGIIRVRIGGHLWNRFSISPETGVTKPPASAWIPTFSFRLKVCRIDEQGRFVRAVRFARSVWPTRSPFGWMRGCGAARPRRSEGFFAEACAERSDRFLGSQA